MGDEFGGAGGPAAAGGDESRLLENAILGCHAAPAAAYSVAHRDPDRDEAMFRILLALAVLLAFTTPASAQLPVGAQAPDFTLQDTLGVPYTLADYSNEVVVLFFVGYG
jgi:hypothetical protein